MVPNGGTYAAKFPPNSFNWASSENLVTTTGKYSSSAKYVLAVDYISSQKYDIISPPEGCFKKQFCQMFSPYFFTFMRLDKLVL